MAKTTLSPAAQEFKRRHPEAARLLERVVMWPYRRRIRRQERARLQALESTIHTCRTQHKKFQSWGLTDTAAVFNASLYVLLFDRDFSSLKDFFLGADNDWDRKMVGRQMAVMLYGGAKDLTDELLDQKFRMILANNDISEKTRTDLDAVRSRLTTFRKTHAKRLNELRNVMAAHRDKDALAQLRMVDELHPMEVYETSVEFWAVIRDLTPVLTNVLAELGTMPKILKQMARRSVPTP
jgi:hypothetical protein